MIPARERAEITVSSDDLVVFEDDGKGSEEVGTGEENKKGNH